MPVKEVRCAHVDTTSDRYLIKYGSCLIYLQNILINFVLIIYSKRKLILHKFQTTIRPQMLVYFDCDIRHKCVPGTNQY